MTPKCWANNNANATTKLTVYILDILCALISEAYRIHPYHNPPNISNITSRLKDHLIDKYEHEFFEISNLQALRHDLEEYLMTDKEFRQFNISKARWEAGQRDIYDESSYWNIMSKDQIENDFIDLEALIQNMMYEISLHCQAQSCFLCKYSQCYGSFDPSDCDVCNYCSCNPNLRFNREIHPYATIPKDSAEWKQLVESNKIPVNMQ